MKNLTRLSLNCTNFSIRNLNTVHIQWLFVYCLSARNVQSIWDFIDKLGLQFSIRKIKA